MRAGKVYKNKIAVLLLVGLLGTSVPQPAHAEIASTYMIIQNAAKAFIDSLTTAFNALLNTALTQAQNDQNHLNVLNGETLRATRDYRRDPNGSHSCDISAHQVASSGIGQGMDKISSSETGAVNQGEGVTAAQSLINACKSGYIDINKASPDMAKAVPNCKPDNNRLDADINPATLDQEMIFPANCLYKTAGKLTICDPSTLKTRGEKAYVDALNYCALQRGMEPDSLANQGQATHQTVQFYDQRRAKQALAPAYYDCTREVNRHTALPESAAALGNDFKEIYNLEQAECNSLIKLGINDPAVLNCKTNGISMSTIERLMLSRYANPDYKSKLYGRNLTTEDVSRLEEEHLDHVEEMKVLERIAKSLNMLNMSAQRVVSSPSPNTLDKKMQ